LKQLRGEQREAEHRQIEPVLEHHLQGDEGRLDGEMQEEPEDAERGQASLRGQPNRQRQQSEEGDQRQERGDRVEQRTGRSKRVEQVEPRWEGEHEQAEVEDDHAQLGEHPLRRTEVPRRIAGRQSVEGIRAQVYEGQHDQNRDRAERELEIPLEPLPAEIPKEVPLTQPDDERQRGGDLLGPEGE
jgi:hypothetical protein